MAKLRTHDDQLLSIFLNQLNREAGKFPHYSQGPPASEAELLPHARLVVRMAMRYGPLALARGLTVMDLIQEGYTGLIKAFANFKPSRGIKFGTYATWWVRARITRAIDESHFRGVRVPGGRREDMKNLDKTIDRLTRRFMRPPTRTEIVEAECQRGVSAEVTVNLLTYSSLYAVGLDAPIGGDDGLTLSDVLSDPGTPLDDEVISKWMMAWIQTYVDTLEDRTRIVIMRRYGLEDGCHSTLQKIADDLEISRERVRQLEREGLKRIKTLMAKDANELVAKNARRAKTAG